MLCLACSVGWTTECLTAVCNAMLETEIFCRHIWILITRAINNIFLWNLAILSKIYSCSSIRNLVMMRSDLIFLSYIVYGYRFFRGHSVDYKYIYNQSSHAWLAWACWHAVSTHNDVCILQLTVNGLETTYRQQSEQTHLPIIVGWQKTQTSGTSSALP